jgi:hypothetical protein
LWRGFKPLDADSKVRTTWVDRRHARGDSQVELSRIILRFFASLRMTGFQS